MIGTSWPDQPAYARATAQAGTTTSVERLITGWILSMPAEHAGSAGIVVDGEFFGVSECARHWGCTTSAAVALALRRGGTVVWTGVQAIEDPVLRHLSRALSHAAAGDDAAPVNINVYLARASKSQLGWHSDPHDVLALQVAGEKHWHFHNGTRTHRMLARDVIAIPNGMEHCTATPEGCVSVHVTFNLQSSLRQMSASALHQFIDDIARSWANSLTSDSVG